MPGPDERIAAPLPSLVAAALERARAFGPVTIRELTAEIEVDLGALSPDESSEQRLPVTNWKLVVFVALLFSAILAGIGLACARP